MSVRDHLSGLGLQDVASRFTDDEQVVSFLVQQYQQAQQAQQMLPYAQRYLANAPQYEKWLEQQQSQAPQQQAKAKFWDPPALQPGWREMAARPDAPYEIKAKVAQYDQYRRDFAEKFLSDPEATLRPLIQDVAQSVSQGMLQQNLGHLQERNHARDFVMQNASWLYQGDQGGGIRRDFQGAPVLTPEGQAFQRYVLEAEQMGLPNVQAQQTYAMRLLNAGRQQAPAVQNQQLKQNFINRPNPTGAVNLSGPLPQPQSPANPVSLADQLRRNLAAAGVTDQMLAEDTR